MDRITPIHWRELLKVFEMAGCVLVGQTGDHLQLKKEGARRRNELDYQMNKGRATPKLSAKGGFATILVLLVMVLVGGVGVGWYLSNTGIIPKFSNPATSEQPPAPPEVPETDTSREPNTTDTTNWKTYTNKNLGIEFMYPDGFSVVKESNNVIELGAPYVPGQPVSTFLTLEFNRSKFTDYKKYKLCSEYTNLKVDEYPPDCLSEEARNILLDQIEAKSFYLDMGVDNKYHIVQTTREPYVKLKMSISGGGLDKRFQTLLSTFRFD